MTIEEKKEDLKKLLQIKIEIQNLYQPGEETV